jgi:hypothetical protein
MATPRLAESGSRQLSDSQSFLLNIQKQTLRLGELESRRVVFWLPENLKPKAERLER